MTMNSEKWEHRLKHLELTHLELDTKIKKLETARQDETMIRQMKKQKPKLLCGGYGRTLFWGLKAS